MPDKIEKVNRCSWAEAPCFHVYHDTVWGRGVYEDNRLFEMLSLELMQSGLSWRTILLKQAAFREAFDQFVIGRVAQFDNQKIDLLLQNPKIIRHRKKIEAVVSNAKIVEQIHGSFRTYIWSFCKAQRAINSEADLLDRARTLSSDLKKKGMRFIGPTVAFSFLQAIGVVNPHEAGCFLHKQHLQKALV